MKFMTRLGATWVYSLRVDQGAYDRLKQLGILKEGKLHMKVLGNGDLQLTSPMKGLKNNRTLQLEARHEEYECNGGYVDNQHGLEPTSLGGVWDMQEVEHHVLNGLPASLILKAPPAHKRAAERPKAERRTRSAPRRTPRTTWSATHNGLTLDFQLDWAQENALMHWLAKQGVEVSIGQEAESAVAS